MTESLLAALDFAPEDKIIAIRENKLADATFILASIMSKCISEDKSICLVTLHNTYSHYQNIGRRLGIDLTKQLQDNRAKLIEPISDIVQDLCNTRSSEKKYFVDTNMIAKQLFLEINDKKNQLLASNKHCCIIIDDLSHLSYLRIDLKIISNFIKHLIKLTLNNDVSIVVSCHTVSKIDDIIANMLFYYASLRISVSALKTGRSKNVSGILTLYRNDQISNYLERQSVYHYKLMEKEIRTFAPGRAIM